eukprot:Hpha_TRINITY_DN15871_c1_g25::TRINITY_DN15871_c1_g25_i1::g.187845::m.187845
MSGDAPRAAVEGGTELVGHEQLRVALEQAFKSLPEHEQAPGHYSERLYGLLHAAPNDAQIHDVVHHCVRCSQRVGIPPALAGIPGKSLLVALYEERIKTLPPPRPFESDTDKKESFEQWQEMSKLLGDSIRMLLTRAEAQFSEEQ